MHQGVLLTVNADDFGFTRDVNRGIIDAHRHGILTATTLMANGDAFADAIRWAGETPTLDIGCHLVLVGGRSSRNGTPLPLTVKELLVTLARGRLAVYDELCAQVDRILAAGIRPTHLDTHKHTHLWPSVLDVVARISREYRIPWVRRPFDLPLTGAAHGVPWAKRVVSQGLGLLRRRFSRTLERYNCRTTDHFAGFQITGRYRAAELANLIEHLPHGLTEFMCHPGYCTAELRGAPTRLKDSRAEELEALMSVEVRQALAHRGVTLVRYSQL